MNLKTFLNQKKLLKQQLIILKKIENEVTTANRRSLYARSLGWREYVRGTHWKQMPEYASLNKLRKL
jgi:deoxyribodipyrimidine photolyase-like uncharacterized protein